MQTNFYCIISACRFSYYSLVDELADPDVAHPPHKPSDGEVQPGSRGLRLSKVVARHRVHRRRSQARLSGGGRLFSVAESKHDSVVSS